MTQAGNLSLSYDASNQQLTGTTLQTVTDSFSYSSDGEVIGYLVFATAPRPGGEAGGTS